VKYTFWSQRGSSEELYSFLIIKENSVEEKRTILQIFGSTIFHASETKNPVSIDFSTLP